jgi:hypothetical protein
VGQIKRATHFQIFLKNVLSRTHALPFRVRYPDAWYHVMNGGRRIEGGFSRKEDYNVFMDLLKKLVKGAI